MAKVTGILGKKVGMTQLFDDKGDVHPATVLQAGPCVITQHKTQTKDGYVAAQIGLVEFVKESRLTKPARGHLGKNNLPPVKFMREVPIEVEEKAEANGDGLVKAGDRVLSRHLRRREVRGRRRHQQRAWLLRRSPAAPFCWRPQVAWFDVSDYGIDWFIGVPVACI
jgi:ribosomal protein L3